MIADVYEDNRGPSHAYQVNPGAFRNIHVEQQYRSGDDWTIRMFYRVKDRPQNYWLAYWQFSYEGKTGYFHDDRMARRLFNDSDYFLDAPIREAAALLAIGGQAPFWDGPSRSEAADTERMHYDTAMVDLVANLHDYAQKQKPDFLLIGNGGTSLLLATDGNTADNASRYAHSVDGIMGESVLYGWDDEPGKGTPEEERASTYISSRVNHKCNFCHFRLSRNIVYRVY